MLIKHFVRDGDRRIIGSVTAGFSDSSTIVRNQGNRTIGRTNERFQTTRDARSKLVSINSSDPGLLIGRKS